MKKEMLESLEAVHTHTHTHTHTSNLEKTKATLKQTVIALLNIPKIQDSNMKPVIDTG